MRALRAYRDRGFGFLAHNSEELYVHGEQPLPVSWAVEHTNVIRAPEHQHIAQRLRSHGDMSVAGSSR